MVSRDCCVALLRGAIGLSTVCDCGISWSYSLFFSRLKLNHSKNKGFHASWPFLVLQQRQNLGRRFGASGVHLGLRWLGLLSVPGRQLRLFLTFWLLLLPLLEFVIVLCFVVRYFMSILVLQSSWWGWENWLLCLICLPGVSRLLCGPSSRCHGFVCGLWMWYFLIILTYYFQ